MATKALELAPTSSEAHHEMAEVKFEDWDWAGAEEESRRAIVLNPNSAEAHCRLAVVLTVLGRMDEAWKESEMAQQLDPNQDLLSGVLYLRGHYDRSIELLHRMHPDDTVTAWNLFLVYGQQGKHADSIRELEKCITFLGFPEIATRLNRAFAISGWTGAQHQWSKELEQLIVTHTGYLPGVLAQVYAQLGEKDKAFYWLEESCKHRHQAEADPILIFVKVDPSFAPLRSDPRFKVLLQHMGIPE
jgi:adenylate cyclase